jgi:hypothetical protein
MATNMADRPDLTSLVIKKTTLNLLKKDRQATPPIEAGLDWDEYLVNLLQKARTLAHMEKIRGMDDPVGRAKRGR